MLYDTRFGSSIRARPSGRQRFVRPLRPPPGVSISALIQRTAGPRSPSRPDSTFDRVRCVAFHDVPSVRGGQDSGGTGRVTDCCFALFRSKDEGGTKSLEGVSAEDLGHVLPRAVLTAPGELLVGARHDAVRRPFAAEVVELAPLSVDFLKQGLRRRRVPTLCGCVLEEGAESPTFPSSRRIGARVVHASRKFSFARRMGAYKGCCVKAMEVAADRFHKEPSGLVSPSN